MICPCCSGKLYDACCKPFHEGKKLPATPEQLMRSRYSAYATGQTFYIEKTTHPQNKQKPRQNIEEFCRTTKFLKLEIIDTGENWVYFHAHLEQNGKPYVLQEKSLFEKIGSQWLYLRGDVTIVE